MSSQVSCPWCKSTYVHIRSVEVFNRSKEDSETGLRVEVKGMFMRSHPSMAGNPSPRRDGLKIRYECETCGEYNPFWDYIYNHKGEVFIEQMAQGAKVQRVDELELL
jgi:hypothetical protein